jgi:hypothetical protein
MTEYVVKATLDPTATRRQRANFPIDGRVFKRREIAEAIVLSLASSVAPRTIVTIEGGTTASQRV